MAPNLYLNTTLRRRYATLTSRHNFPQRSESYIYRPFKMLALVQL